ncbi:MAG: tetratricopeptide repeat protein [Crocinitomicaceae bacterium]|nr:tetratricopeptide repeat protein [Crocinitomicaceae bacterium]
MNTLVKNICLGFGAMVITTGAFAQKSKITDAALSRRTALEEKADGKNERAMELLLKAKESIDAAAAHVDTKNNQKMFYYKGDIYAQLAMLIVTDPKKTDKSEASGYIEESIAALTSGFPLGKKYKSQITETVANNRGTYNQLAIMAYDNGMYEGAAKAYETQAKFASCIDMIDSNAYYMAGASYYGASKFELAGPLFEKAVEINYNMPKSAEFASSSYRSAKQYDKAKAIISKARQEFPTHKGLLLESVNTSIDMGDSEGAETALNEAIAKDPNNKLLYYNIGYIYIDLKKNEKAEEALQKALEIDPSYSDAQYQLGAHLVGWAGDLQTAAKQTKEGDENYKIWMDQSTEIFKRAIIPLENYIEANPNEKAVLNILFQIYRSIDNSEKALEYKRRADAIAD